MKSIKTFIFLLIASSSVCAETVYVTEKLKMAMRSGTSTRHKILKMLPSGSALTIVSKNPETGYSQVRTSAGLQGYVLTHLTQKKPPARKLLDQVNTEMEQLKAENKQLSESLLALQDNSNLNVTDKSQLIIERDQINRELQELKQTAGNAIQLKQQRDQLQERVVNIERENQQLKRENQALDDTSNQDWFLNGGIVAFFGIFFGLLIPKLSWHRRRGGWDSF